MKPDTIIPMSMTLAEWNVILAAINELPARVANPLLNKMQQQASDFERGSPPVAVETSA